MICSTNSLCSNGELKPTEITNLSFGMGFANPKSIRVTFNLEFRKI